MTFDDVRAYGRSAFLSLPDGDFLKYHSEDGVVRHIRFPYKPEECDCLAVSGEHIPTDGWRHAARCGCSRCRPDGCDVG